MHWGSQEFPLVPKKPPWHAGLCAVFLLPCSGSRSTKVHAVLRSFILGETPFTFLCSSPRHTHTHRSEKHPVDLWEISSKEKSCDVVPAQPVPRDRIRAGATLRTEPLIIIQGFGFFSHPVARCAGSEPAGPAGSRISGISGTLG